MIMLREPRGLGRRLWRKYRPAFNHANRKAQKIEQSDQSKEIEVNSIFIANPMYDAMPVKVVQAVVFVGFFQKSFTNEIAEHLEHDKPFSVTIERGAFPFNDMVE